MPDGPSAQLPRQKTSSTSTSAPRLPARARVSAYSASAPTDWQASPRHSATVCAAGRLGAEVLVEADHAVHLGDREVQHVGDRLDVLTGDVAELLHHLVQDGHQRHRGRRGAAWRWRGRARPCRSWTRSSSQLRIGVVAILVWDGSSRRRWLRRPRTAVSKPREPSQGGDPRRSSLFEARLRRVGGEKIFGYVVARRWGSAGRCSCFHSRGHLGRPLWSRSKNFSKWFPTSLSNRGFSGFECRWWVLELTYDQVRRGARHRVRGAGCRACGSGGRGCVKRPGLFSRCGLGGDALGRLDRGRRDDLRGPVRRHGDAGCG